MGSGSSSSSGSRIYFAVPSVAPATEVAEVEDEAAWAEVVWRPSAETLTPSGAYPLAAESVSDDSGESSVSV